MGLLRLLWRIELRIVAALLTCAILMAAVGAIGEILNPGPQDDPSGAAQYMFLITLMFGTLPAVLYGGPIYAFAAHMRRLSWPLVLVVGTAPGLILLFFERGVGLFFLTCGACVAVTTHLYSRHLLIQPSGL